MSASEDDEASPKEAAKPKKSKKTIFLILVVVVLVGGAATAGVLLGPALAGTHAPAGAPGAASAEHGPEEEAVEEAPGSVSVDPIVVDLRDADGAIHHLKVALAFELKKGVADGEFRAYVPRGREAAIAYLRADSFEGLTAPEKFTEVRTELSKRVLAALGEKKVARVLITDFVAQ